MMLETLHMALAGHAVTTDNEAELSDAVRRLLDARGIRYETEVRLDARDRLDFLVGTVAIELKVKGSLAALLRQLDRYARHERIDSLLVATTLRRLTYLPAALHGKRIEAVHMGAA